MAHAHVGCIMSKAHAITFCVSFASIIFSIVRHSRAPLGKKVYVGSHFLCAICRPVPCGIIKRNMKIRLCFDANRVDVDKLSGLISELNKLGVYHNGEIICDPEMDDLVQKVMDSYFIEN